MTIGLKAKVNPSFFKTNKTLIIRGKAPLRISFAGGGTDVAPYPEEHGGCVLSCTIDKYSYSTLIPEIGDSINVKSLDYDIFTSYDTTEEFKYDGKLDLVKGALKVLNVNKPVSLFLHSDLPPGAGLGASSAMTTALVGTLMKYKDIHLDNYDIAELAYQIEREEVGIKGGRQDEYASTFGGFNFIEFFGDKTVVNPLRIKQDVLNELQYRLMLCYTGKRRLSAGIIEDQVNRYLERRGEVAQALDETKKLAVEMKNNLLLGKIDDLGYLLHCAWMLKRKFSNKVSDSEIDDLYEIALRKGALGGKLLGAGGGGYLLFLCRFDRKHEISKELEEHGGKILNFAFDLNGLQTWEVNRTNDGNPIL